MSTWSPGATCIDRIGIDRRRRRPRVAIHHNCCLRNGKRLDVDCCIVFRIEHGRVVDGSENFYDLYAWDEFWA